MSIRRILLLGLTALVLCGCRGAQEDLRAFVADVRSRPSPPIQPIPEFQSYNPYTYVASQRRPPFNPMVTARPARTHASSGDNGLHPNLKRPLDPLEAFPLDALNMVGTMTVDGVRYALIRAPDGVVYRADAGDHAGHDYGEIVDITETTVRLSEIVPNGRGGYMRSSASIPLSR